MKNYWHFCASAYNKNGGKEHTISGIYDTENKMDSDEYNSMINDIHKHYNINAYTYNIIVNSLTFLYSE